MTYLNTVFPTQIVTYATTHGIRASVESWTAQLPSWVGPGSVPGFSEDQLRLVARQQRQRTVRRLMQARRALDLEGCEQMKQLGMMQKDIGFLEQLNAEIAALFDNPFIQLADLAKQMAYSERQLNRKVKHLTGVGPLDLLRDHRLNMGREKLNEGLQVSQVSELCGFNSLSYFCCCFKKKFGVTPKQYQQKRRYYGPIDPFLIMGKRS